MTPLYTSLEKGRPYVLSVLRIVVALLFLEHGLQKYVGFPSAGPPMTTLLYVQGVIEIVGGILLLIGAYTRVVGFVLAGDMAAAYFMAHLPALLLPCGEWRRRGRTVLLGLLLHLLRRRRALERRSRLAEAGLGLARQTRRSFPEARPCNRGDTATRNQRCAARVIAAVPGHRSHPP